MEPSLLAGKVVLDVVHGGPTRLLRETERRGGVALAGRVMWSEQGRRQLQRWLGLDVSAEELEVDR
jgi:shikimate 5-dehydrogenase